MSGTGDWEKARAAEAAVHAGPHGFQSRRGWLRVFGGFMMLVGLLLCLGIWGILSEAGNPTFTMEAGDQLTWAQGLLFSALLAIPAAINLSLGWGSIRTRRWARALVRIGTGSALVMLLFCLVGMVAGLFFIPELSGSGGEGLFGVGLALFMFVVVFVLPNWLGFWFYGSPNVVATVNHFDSVERWTDRKPLLVIGIFLWIIGCFVAVVLGLFTTSIYLPEFTMPAAFFGLILPPTVGMVTHVLATALILYYSWLFWKLDLRGWRGLMALMAFYLVSGAVTQLVLTPTEINAAMYGQEMAQALSNPEMDQMAQIFGAANFIVIFGVYSWFMWRARKHFFPQAQ